MQKNIIQNIFKYSIATVWITNGLICKVLNFVPRHEQIVARILGDEFSRPLTILIGISEIGMAIWFLSGIKSRLNTIAQIGIVATMNILEFILVPDLLLWGKLNSMFAFLFIIAVYFNHFHLNKKAV
ncbi:MAG TPA: hypothetical protein DEO36_11455 [Flavobacteriaceae bacterium]|jgi:uncharacterized membrane protein YphA (DoxX/SURF4 family)|nr:hypothetical protein [Flavobacteriaceae bacterium]